MVEEFKKKELIWIFDDVLFILFLSVVCALVLACLESWILKNPVNICWVLRVVFQRFKSLLLCLFTPCVPYSLSASKRDYSALQLDFCFYRLRGSVAVYLIYIYLLFVHCTCRLTLNSTWNLTVATFFSYPRWKLSIDHLAERAFQGQNTPRRAVLAQKVGLKPCTVVWRFRFFHCFSSTI